MLNITSKAARFATLAIAIVSVTVFANTAGASAAFCPADVGYSPSIDDNVSASDGCQIGSTNNDRLGGDASQYQVNQDMMFGFDDWIFAAKAMDSDQDMDIGLSLVGDTISGQWSIDDIWNTMGVSSLMLVLKSGNGEPDSYVGYLITPNTTAGDYLTPFINAASGNPKDISQVSAYFRTAAVTTVPEPGSIVLIAIGLLVMTGLLARRRQRRAPKLLRVRKIDRSRLK
ncbi:MAG: PEP-CTERM sorting domain-containing protein [Gammaproteobacteria bacterium]|nr:PEP-CTERM sorting domain-containing protein [Gammaproteobacteria bacterium]